MRYVICLLLFAAPAYSQTAKVTVYAPPMLVLKQRIGLWQAQREDCQVTVSYSDGRTHTARLSVGVLSEAGDAVIPATYVRGVLRKAVDPCMAAGTFANGDAITICLPAEPVVFSRLERQGLRLRVVMVALPIDCPTTLKRADGHTYAGIVHFNACEAHAIGRGARLADATTTPEATLVLSK